MPNYVPPVFDPDVAKQLQKPARGSRVLAKEDADAERAKREAAVRKDVHRFQPRCRWPMAHKCRGGLECAHMLDASLGGAYTAENLIRICAWIHRRGPESIHGKQLAIEPQTPRGARDGLLFYRKGDDGIFYLVARETAPYVLERD
jgi:hypothetical protein